MTRPTTHKRPTGRGCFSWARAVSASGTITWRLYQSDCRLRTLCAIVRYPINHQCELVNMAVADQLRKARNRLRALVGAPGRTTTGVAQ
ncbi:hypothetical protein [Dyella lutea]|uniref:Transposase n=1 Tax=Dyella lutea TaxID=2950441 RepID=A0ABT1FF37_9GAMM|nr:hypothetical protein [Dyella lutea]MCP1375985.1 hypothetical protein [Dyella lutea]